MAVSSNSPLLHYLGLISVIISIFYTSSNAAEPYLSLDYYSSSCPSVLETIRSEMECAVYSNPRDAASILRLHFHDCFVQGCDGSILLDDTITLQGEKEASPNVNSLRSFELVDRIKNKLESECPGIVSCADLLTIAARDAVLLVGGPYWDVPLGRKDSKSAGFALANTNLPTPEESLVNLISKFLYQGLSVTDMVALVGAHTVGLARCVNFRERIYGDFLATAEKDPITETDLNNLKSVCPVTGEDDNTYPMDYFTPNLFDNSFYHQLLRGEGLLNSDQEMYSSMLGFETKDLVRKYAEDSIAFFQQFSDSMVKMGNITNPESLTDGEVRKNCRFVNT
ncbi:peroxidase superfamily protein [Tasmannia lanceolata]|uniref:peroxidase superfamily protein n=1 Tax=Tasmannia lanceolata TaxID=3420 RepID=UPI004063F233